MTVTLVELARDRADRYRSMGAFGKPVYQSHVQLRAMLLAQRKPHLAEYFAKPHFDPDSAELRWTTELPGAALRRDELDAESRVLGDARLASLRTELAALIESLRRQGGSAPGGAASFASLLEQASKVPAGGDFLRFVGEQPVISFWGFEDASGRSVDPAALTPLIAPVVAPPPLQPEPPPPPEPAPKRRAKWSWWLLPLLLLLLLALLAWWWWSDRSPPAAPVAGPDLQIPPGALERGDLAFLEGDWQLGEGRLTSYEGRQDNVTGDYRMVLRFERDGRGSNRAIERVYRNQSVPDCRGGLSARTDGAKLMFERGDCDTPGRPDLRLNGSRHECVREADGRTMCYGLNRDGVRWNAPLKRLQ